MIFFLFFLVNQIYINFKVAQDSYNETSTRLIEDQHKITEIIAFINKNNLSLLRKLDGSTAGGST